MTYAIAPALRHAPDLAARIEPERVVARHGGRLRSPQGFRRGASAVGQIVC
jgi:hypothetical protein